MTIKLNAAEFDALCGLPHSVICLYVMAIRPRMNYATGLVGIRPYISWQALTEWVYVEPHVGAPTVQASRWAVMRAAWRLRAAGLIRIASNIGNRQLIFECILADRDRSVRNKAATKPQGQAARSKPAPHKGDRGEAARGHNGQAAIHPVSGSSITTALAVNSIYDADEPLRGAASKKRSEEPLRGPSSKPGRSKTVFQEKSARSRPMTDAEIERLPPAIKEKLQRNRAAKRRKTRRRS